MAARFSLEGECIMKLLALALAALLFSGAAFAQTYPVKPIRTVMTIGPGGGGEAAARLIAQKAGDALGQPMIVESHGGAAGAVGAELVARSAPDGYTIAYAISSTMILRRFLTRNTSYDTQRDFTPIMHLGETVACVVAGPSIPGETLAKVLDYVKRNPGKVSYGSSGIGTTHHLAGVMVGKLAGAPMVHVPYKSGAQSAVDALSGRIDLAFNILGTLQPQVAPGKLRILAINNSKRFHRLPDLPTIGEVLPGYARAPSWTGYFGPAGLPQPIVRRLYDELHRAATHPDTVAKLDQLGIPVETLDPAAFTAYIRQNLEVTAKLMKTAGIEPE